MTKNQGGFTLVELMISVGIFGIIAVVVSSLFLSGFRGWMFSSASIMAHQQGRVSRDLIIKLTRNASTSTVQLGRLNNSQPPLSMISYTDSRGINLMFYQEGQALYHSKWTLTSGVRVPVNPSILIPSKLQVFNIYYPNIKDMSNINFSVYVSWKPFADAGKPVEVQMVGDIEMRNP